VVLRDRNATTLRLRNRLPHRLLVGKGLQFPYQPDWYLESVEYLGQPVNDSDTPVPETRQVGLLLLGSWRS
jgi:hypothetical protein